MLWELAVPAAIWVMLVRASISGFLPSNASGSLKKDFAFLVNLSLTHGWIILLPLLPLGLCQVRWRSRRTLQRDTLGKKRVLAVFPASVQWMGISDSFLLLSPICVVGLQDVDRSWSQEWLDSCMSALSVFIAPG